MVSEVKLVVLVILYLIFMMSGLYDGTQHLASNLYCDLVNIFYNTYNDGKIIWI